MRKSNRLASIHDDDDEVCEANSKDVNEVVETLSSNPPAALNTKKFVPTIPTVRRKKLVVEDDDDEGEKPKTDLKSTKPANTRAASTRRQPISASSVVSGPLSMGPASMPRPTRPSASASSGLMASSRTITSKLSSRSNSNSTDDAKPLADSVPIEEAFSSANFDLGQDLLLKPVALTNSHEEAGEPFIHFEDGKLFLFQMPPILPTPLGAQVAKDQQAEKWPSGVQGRYGKLRRYKSGRIALVLENGVEFSVSSSVESNDANSSSTSSALLAIDPEFAQCFNIGSIDSKLVCTPEFEKFQKLEI